MKIKEQTYTKYQTSDGAVFDTLPEAEAYSKKVQVEAQRQAELDADKSIAEDLINKLLSIANKHPDDERMSSIVVVMENLIPDDEDYYNSDDYYDSDNY